MCLQAWVIPIVEGPFWFLLKVFLHFVFLCLGARHAAALPVRPADEFRVEIAAAGGDCEPGGDGVYRDGAEPMSVELVLFFTCAILAMAGGLLLIFLREPIHSALALILVMISLAVLYLLLGAEFIAAIQIIVYAGAIMVLVRVRDHAAERGRRRAHEYQPDREICGRAAGNFSDGRTGLGDPGRDGQAICRAFAGRFRRGIFPCCCFKTYVFPFEATSILILIAILGAVVLAKRDF